jgi:hypothetical protein
VQEIGAGVIHFVIQKQPVEVVGKVVVVRHVGLSPAQAVALLEPAQGVMGAAQRVA